MRHTFGHYVAKCVLEHGTAEQKQRIVRALYVGPSTFLHRNGAGSGLMRNALHRNASYVLATALERCCREDAWGLAADILDNGVAALGQNPFGSHVVRAGESMYVTGGTVYAFRAGPEGLRFFNFRPRMDVTFRTVAETRAER